MGYGVWRTCLQKAPFLCADCQLKLVLSVQKSLFLRNIHVGHDCTVSIEEGVHPRKNGLWGAVPLITHPPDPSHWPHKETDGEPEIAQKSHWFLAT